MPLPLLSATLWDLRAMCEDQVRALTDAQRQADRFRDAQGTDESEAALKQLLADLDRVVRANIAVRDAVRDAVEHARTLSSPARAGD